MKMIAFYNNKGGVGKTSTAINIAYTLSRRQNRILLVDFDGQCNSSRFFTDLANDECGCESAIVNAEEMPLIKSTRYDNIDIVTSSMRTGKCRIFTLLSAVKLASLCPKKFSQFFTNIIIRLIIPNFCCHPIYIHVADRSRII